MSGSAIVIYSYACMVYCYVIASLWCHCINVASYNCLIIHTSLYLLGIMNLSTRLETFKIKDLKFQIGIVKKLPNKAVAIDTVQSYLHC